MRKSNARAVAPIHSVVKSLARKAERMKPAAVPSELRALTRFDQLPNHCGTFHVADAGSEPHLHIGEYAVVDVLDTEPQHGELYILQNQGGCRRRWLCCIREDQGVKNGSYRIGNDPSVQYWWAGDLRGFRQTSERVAGSIPVFAGLSDGPYSTEHLRSKLVGRVVGYAVVPMVKVIAPEAGYRDEAAGNAAFDPAEYVDTLLRAGYRLAVCGNRHMEYLPERRCTAAEEEAVMAVRWKFVEASTAIERVRAECLRRGLAA
jgi:hypothetical protein